MQNGLPRLDTRRMASLLMTKIPRRAARAGISRCSRSPANKTRGGNGTPSASLRAPLFSAVAPADKSQQRVAARAQAVRQGISRVRARTRGGRAARHRSRQGMAQCTSGRAEPASVGESTIDGDGRDRRSGGSATDRARRQCRRPVRCSAMSWAASHQRPACRPPEKSASASARGISDGDAHGMELRIGSASCGVSAHYTHGFIVRRPTRWAPARRRRAWAIRALLHTRAHGSSAAASVKAYGGRGETGVGRGVRRGVLPVATLLAHMAGAQAQAAATGTWRMHRP
jgi:hypothetical protein